VAANVRRFNDTLAFNYYRNQFHLVQGIDLLAMKILVALLLAAICTAAEADLDSWELDTKELRRYAATPDSKLVKEMLAEPIERDLVRAEMARIALSIMGQDEQARLLKDYLAREVAAELLDLPHRKAATVGEAIAQQRANPTPLDTALWRQAWAAAKTKGLLSDDGWTLKDRGLYMSSPGSFFRRGSSPGDLAHQRLLRSTCYELGKCGYLTSLFQQKSTRGAVEGFWRPFAVLVGGAIFPWLVIRAFSWLPYSFGSYGNRLRRPLWAGLLLAPLLTVLLYGALGILTGGVVLLWYVLAAGMWGLVPLLTSYVEAISILMPVVVLLGRYGRLSFARVVLTATASGIVLPPVWAYLAFGDWEHLSGGSAFRIGVFLLVMSIVFCLITRPNNESGEEVGVSRPDTPRKARMAWFVPLIGAHAALLAWYLYIHGSTSPGGILSTSLLPWQLLAWAPGAGEAGNLVRVVWSLIVWLTTYWLLTGVMVRLTSSSGDTVQGEAAT
jgi:hypothetical protein